MNGFRILNSTLSWHSNYGFKLNNREEAALVWSILILIGFTIGVLLEPNIRSTLLRALRTAVAPKLAIVWIVYFVWIVLFIYIANQIGIWQNALTKDTLIWSVTAGISVLIGFSEVKKLGYFRQELSKMVSVLVIFEYVVNLSSFSFWMEFILQPLLFVLVIPPSLGRDREQQKNWRRIRVRLSAILIVVIVGHTIRTLYASWQTVNWELFALRAMWPMLLGMWVLALVFFLAVIANYEKAFTLLRLYRNEREGLWRAKLGLILALGIRLRWIHEAAKGGTKHVANAESVSTAYKAAKRYKADLAAKRQ